ncbi:glycosyl transferase family 90-domain-containing protein [Mycena vitilis]|nr:glycosyl transferase family 90-domain-containing protein [Mycena vitilis]
MYQQLPHHEHNNSAHAEIDALYAHQSSTLAQAAARYSLRNNRPPPPNYDTWFRFARDRQCLIDEYHQISKDFEPFYQLAREDPGYFKQMVDRSTLKIVKDGSGMTTGRFRGAFIPNTNILINGRDEPRVMFDYRRPNIQETVLNAVADPAPFEHAPHSTAMFFKDRHCRVPNQPLGFTELANDASACIASTQFTTELYPLMSLAKVSPCFADILVPSEFYYSDSGWAPRYAYPDNIVWDERIPRLYWRGKASGGQISGSNYREFPRFRAADIGRVHPALMDIAISGFHDTLCGPHCDAAKIKSEYNITGASVPREEVYRYKYVLDIDGNSFSGRYLGLLRSGSLVFKSTVFEEYFSDWLRPFVQYIPVLPDLSDLMQKIEWAIAHDAEAHAIQEAGQAMAERVLTDAQNDCYFSAVLLEWSQLHSWSVNVTTPG